MAATGSGRSPGSIEQQQQQQAAVDDIPNLPVELLTLVFQDVPDSSLKSVRLCSSQFATATAPLVSCITFRQWPNATVSLRRFAHATHLQLELQFANCPQGKQGPTFGCYKTSGACPQEIWLQLQHLVTQLPQLRSLHLPCWDIDSSSSSSNCSSNIPRMPSVTAACLTTLTRLDLQDLAMLPYGLQLPRLKAASFTSNDVTVDLTAVAAFAPNLQQLRCKQLLLSTATTTAAAAAADDQQVHALAAAADGPMMQHAAAGASCLQHCTHFGARAVTVAGATSPAAAAAAFGAAFPSLNVLFRVPQVSGMLSQGVESHKDAGYDELLEHLPGLRAIRGRNWFASRSWFLIGGSDSLAKEHWRKLRSMSFHSHSYPDGSSDFLDISKSPQLEYLRLTFNYPYTKADDLVRELQKLPHLSQLALPAALVCGRCCPEKHYPGLGQRLEGLVANQNLRKLQLLTLPEAAVGLATFHCCHHEHVREGMAALQQRVTVIRRKPGLAVPGTQDGQAAGAAAAASAAQGTAADEQLMWLAKQQPLQRQQQAAELEIELVIEDPQWSDDSYAAGRDAGHAVWGVYVSRHEC